jgi:hypothetical protein
VCVYFFKFSLYIQNKKIVLEKSILLKKKNLKNPKLVKTNFCMCIYYLNKQIKLHTMENTNLTDQIERLCEAVEQLNSTIAEVFRPTDGYHHNSTLTDVLFDLTYELRELNKREGK